MDWSLTESSGVDPLVCREMAENILRNLENSFMQKQERAVVDPRQFRHLDLGFYARAQRQIERQGFRHLGDYEIATSNRKHREPGANLWPTFVRALVSADGTISAGIFHVKTRGLWLRFLKLITRGKRDPKVFEFETEYSDGTLLCTTTGNHEMMVPEQIKREVLPRNSSVETLLKRHRERMEAKAKDAESVPVGTRTLEDVFASEARFDEIRVKFREAMGWITREELERIAPGKKPITDAVYEAMQKLLAERKAAEEAPEALCGEKKGQTTVALT